MFVLDSHCDTPSQILRLRDISKDNDHAHVDFPKLKRGGVDGAFFALYVPSSYDERPDEALAYALLMLEAVQYAVRDNADKASFAYSYADAMKNKADGLFSVFLGLENGSALASSPSILDMLYNKGVRYITLCHSGNNAICDSCAPQNGRWGGLSPFGKEIVSEMNRLRMLIDVSHASDDTFYDVLEHSSRPVAATHSCCRALCGHRRNLTDGMIRDLASHGGVIQINFYPLFLDDAFKEILQISGIGHRCEIAEREFVANPSDVSARSLWYAIQDELAALSRPSFRLIADHIDHAVEVAGIDHVGIGSDFDGIEVTPEGMDDISMLPFLFDELRSRGYSEHDLAKIAGGNFFRILG